jgi:hypothetical protein
VELEPWWGAWSPPILALIAGVVAVGLMVVWAVLAAVYCGPASLVAFFANRAVGWWATWRLVEAALMPGAIFFIGTIILYRFGLLDLVHLVVATAAHFVIGWAYVIAGLWRAPRAIEKTAATENPFASNELKLEDGGQTGEGPGESKRVG